MKRSAQPHVRKPERGSLRLRLTMLYTAAGFAFLATLGTVAVVAAFTFYTRPLAIDLAKTARAAELEAAQSEPGDSLPALSRRVLGGRRRLGVGIIAIPNSSGDERVTRLPPGEISVAALLGISPTFITAREGTLVVVPDTARMGAIVDAFTAAVALTLGAAFWIAFIVGRAGARISLRPLSTVTAELERFGRGDFTPRSLDITDATELGSLATAYNAAAEKVSQAFLERRRAEDQIRAFVAEAGHELRTPLTVVAGYMDVLRRGGFDDRSIRDNAFNSLSAEIKRMRTLVERLMTLARLDRVLESDPEVVDVAAIVGQAVHALGVIAPVPIRLEATPDLLVLGEPVDVYEAVANLIENAIKYGDRTPVDVTITEDGGEIAVRVRDGGPGIPASDRARIFERFYRGTDRGDVAGSGLGLAIAVKAGDRLRGRVVLEDPGPGSTTFALLMPALRDIPARDSISR